MLLQLYKKANKNEEKEMNAEDIKKESQLIFEFDGICNDNVICVAIDYIHLFNHFRTLTNRNEENNVQ